MAKKNRLSSLERAVESLRNSSDADRDRLQNLEADQTANFDELREMIKAIGAQKLEKGTDSRPETANSTVSSGKVVEICAPRIDFPRFNGVDARRWIRKCRYYFALNPTEDHEKVLLAGVFLEDAAEFWFLEHVDGKESIGWDQFVDMFLIRFASVREGDVIEEFNKLKQFGSVDKYIDKFSELRFFMLQRNSHFDEDYFVRSFCIGLKKEIRHMVQMMAPRSLEGAFGVAKNQELLLESMDKAGRTNSSSSKSRTKEARQVGSEKQLTENSDDEDVNSEVPLYALQGRVPINTIKLAGKVGDNILVILVATGSTHSFIDPSAAERVNCKVVATNPLQVTVSGGANMECNSICPHLEWEMAGHSFSASVRVLPLSGYDMVMGVDLMRKLSPVMFDYDKRTVTFDHEGERVSVHAVTSVVSVSH